MKLFLVSVYFFCLFGCGVFASVPSKDAKNGLEWGNLKSLLPVPIDPLKLNGINQTYCTCGVFFSGQFKKGSSESPKGYPVLMHEQDTMYQCTPMGTKQCSNKCLETVIFISSYFSPSFSVKLFIIFFLIRSFSRLLSICQTRRLFSVEALIVMYSESAPTYSFKTAMAHG